MMHAEGRAVFDWAGEVRPAGSTCEAGEQSDFGCGGTGGEKRRGQEECGPASHAPDSESGCRVTGAGSHT